MNDFQTTPSRDDLASAYLDALPYDPYPVQEEALLAWFSSEQGVLMCSPTGTGKTLVAEAALFEALHTRSIAYYTTPLIALTEQKFQEVQDAAVRWGFSADDVGLVTGNRRVNPDARVLVVVAEILLNRLLHSAAFDFRDVSAVVMDEFHSFADPERGVVWELTLGMLPKHVRLLLLSATVGNAADFLLWLRRSHNRKLQLVQSFDRKVPLRFVWVGDQLLNEQLQLMSAGDEESRRTPALVFCFNRNECWTVAEQLKGKHLLSKEDQRRLTGELEKYDWSDGAGNKLKQILTRGVGVHHAGLLPKYRRIVEELFQRKLLTVCVCTETLAAGMNLPARSVVLTELLKGPHMKRKLVDASTAHQIFGRAGRPQYDTQGYVYALAHEDDVKILRWREKYDQIPEDTKDPNLRRAKKQMKKKMPTRRSNQQYWSEKQFEKLQQAPPGKLSSRGGMPWRLLAYLLTLSPDVLRLRSFVHQRLMEPAKREQGERRLTQMLLTLWAGGYVTLDPEPPAALVAPQDEQTSEAQANERGEAAADAPAEPELGTFGQLLQEAREESETGPSQTPSAKPKPKRPEPPAPEYQPRQAVAQPSLERLLVFRSVNPIYADFLNGLFARADFSERLQLFESVLDIAGAVFRQVRVPPPDVLPPGPLATEFLDSELLTRGLATAEELRQPAADEDDWRREPPLALADKARRLFDAEFPGVNDVRTRPIWVAGDLLSFGGDFNKYVRGRDLTKQEGIIFRHLLRLILLCGEFAQVCPPGFDLQDWQRELGELSKQLTASCRAVDPESTDKMVEAARNAVDIVKAEST